MTLLAMPEHAWGWGHGGGPWFWWPLIPLLWIGLIGTVIWFVARRTGTHPMSGTAANPDGSKHDRTARQILAERYARGELSTEEYHERLENLLD